MIATPTLPPTDGLPFVSWLGATAEEDMKEDEGTRKVLPVLPSIGTILCEWGGIG